MSINKKIFHLLIYAQLFIFFSCTKEEGSHPQTNNLKQESLGKQPLQVETEIAPTVPTEILETVEVPVVSSPPFVPAEPSFIYGSQGGLKPARTGNNDDDDNASENPCDFNVCPRFTEIVDKDGDDIPIGCDCDDNNGQIGRILGSPRYVNPSGSDANNNDCLSENTPCATIIYAISQANPGDTLILSVGTFTESNIQINKDLAIFGAGPEITIVDANQQNGVFTVEGNESTPDVVFCGMTIEGGSSGGINNLGIITVTNTTIRNNFSGAGGGIAVGNNGTATIINSTLNENSARNGGAIIIQIGSAVSVANSTISENIVDGQGAGIGNFGTLFLNNSTISDNRRDEGQAGNGIRVGVGAVATISHTIIADQEMNGDDCENSGTINSLGYNLSSNDTCNFNQPTDKPTGIADLQALNYNGGPLNTMALGNNSEAIDMGDSSCGVATDQRGFPRPINSNCDIGAFEKQ